jgi:nucleoside-diphosphate-sugar epimerase
MSRILITGAAGFIGSVLVGKLLKEGHHVVGYDNLMYGQQSLLQYIPNPNFKFVWGDVTNNNEEYKELILNSDFILPLACLVGAPSCDREESKSYDVNENAIVDIPGYLEFKDRQDIKIIFPTSNSGYGSKSGEVYCTEETPLEPISHYGKQKVEAERYLLINHPNTVTLRLATVFGVSPRMRLDLLVNFFVWKAVTENILTVAQPEAKRNYVHINDVCDCFIHCINNFSSMRGGSYNVGLDANHSKMELAKIVQEFTDCEILETKSYIDPDKRDYVVSNKKIQNAGFTPSLAVEEAVPSIVEACKMIQFLNYGRMTYKNA